MDSRGETYPIKEGCVTADVVVDYRLGQVSINIHDTVFIQTFHTEIAALDVSLRDRTIGEALTPRLIHYVVGDVSAFIRDKVLRGYVGAHGAQRLFEELPQHQAS